MIPIAISLEQELRHRGGDLIGWMVARFERPQRIGRAVRPAGLSLPLTVTLEGTLQVGQRQGDGPLEGVLIDREAAGAGDTQGDERDSLIVAREAIALLRVDDQALLQRRQGPPHGGPDLGGGDIDGRHDLTRAAAGLGGLRPPHDVGGRRSRSRCASWLSPAAVIAVPACLNRFSFGSPSE